MKRLLAAALLAITFAAGCSRPVEVREVAAVVVTATPTLKSLPTAFPASTPINLGTVRVVAPSQTALATTRKATSFHSPRASSITISPPAQSKESGESGITPRQYVGLIGLQIRNARSRSALYRIEASLNQTERDINHGIYNRWMSSGRGSLRNDESSALAAITLLRGAAQQQEGLVGESNSLITDDLAMGVNFQIGLAINAMPPVTAEEREDDARHRESARKYRQKQARKEQEVVRQNQLNRLRTWQNRITSDGGNSGRISVGSGR